MSAPDEPILTEQPLAIHPGRAGWPWEGGAPVSEPASADRFGPRVSVVTPSFRQAAFLEATIRSVLLQGYPNLEYLIMDGGSMDGSVDIIKRYARYLAYWESQPDAGQADAINRGWRRAQGDILAYLNSDDLYLPGAIQRAVEYLERHPDTGIVYGPCQVVDEQGRSCGGTREMADCSLPRLLRHPLPQPTMFFRRWVFDRIGWLDQSFHCVMDWDLTIRAVIEGIPIGRLSGDPLAAVRVWSGAKTSNLFEQCVEESLRLRDKLLSRSNLSPDVVREIRLSKASAFFWPAYEYYIRGRTRAARQLLHRAVATRPGIVSYPEFMGLYLRTWLGPSGSRTARRLKAHIATRVRQIGIVSSAGTGGTGGWRLQSPGVDPLADTHARSDGRR